MPKAGKPFQSESVKALSPEELGRLLEVVAAHAAAKQPVHLRDHALLQFYVATGVGAPVIDLFKRERIQARLKPI